MRGLRDQSKVACLFCDLLSFGVDVAVIQEKSVCSVDAWVLSSDFLVYSAYGDQLARGVSLLVKHILSMRRQVWLIEGDIAVSNNSGGFVMLSLKVGLECCPGPQDSVWGVAAMRLGDQSWLDLIGKFGLVYRY